MKGRPYRLIRELLTGIMPTALCLDEVDAPLGDFDANPGRRQGMIVED